MQLHTYLRKSLQAALASAALGGLLFFAAVPKAQAADRDDGERRNSRTEYRPQDRGYYGSQAREWRHEGYERHDRFRSRDDRYRDDDRYQRRFGRDRD